MWAGWKKWEPAMRSGWAMRSPSRVMGRPEVLLASTVSLGAAASMRRNTSCFGFEVLGESIRRRTARCRRLPPARWSRGCGRSPRRPSPPSADRAFAGLRRPAGCRPWPGPGFPGAGSSAAVSRLPRARTRAIWLPMRPPPTTADLSINRSGSNSCGLLVRVPWSRDSQRNERVIRSGDLPDFCAVAAPLPGDGP